VLCTAACAVFVPAVEDVFSVVAGIFGSLIVFVIPCFMWLGRQQGSPWPLGTGTLKDWGERAVCWLFILLGLAVATTTTVRSIQTLVHHSPCYPETCP